LSHCCKGRSLKLFLDRLVLGVRSKLFLVTGRCTFRALLLIVESEGRHLADYARHTNVFWILIDITEGAVGAHPSVAK
jgi:hypothetical protein